MNTTTFPPPPAYLRERVHGAGDVKSFWAVGACAANDIMRVLPDSDRYQSVLDFGCGCGRVLPFMQEKLPHARFSAADIDAEAIAWVQEAFPDVRAITTQDMPPLPYRHSSFDLIYAVSVWTHLDEARQHAWLAEMRRILRPGGLLIASLHGERAASRIMGHGSRSRRRASTMWRLTSGAMCSRRGMGWHGIPRRTSRECGGSTLRCVHIYRAR